MFIPTSTMKNSRKVFFSASITLFILHITATQQQSSQEGFTKPSPRWANECVLLQSKGVLQCFGGQLETGSTTNSMYSLDLYQSWNTTVPAWSLIDQTLGTSGITSPTSFFAATYLPDLNLFLIDGGTSSTAMLFHKGSSNQTIYYDTKNETWTAPVMKGQLTNARRKQHTAVSDALGRAWIWGGVSDNSTNGGFPFYYNTWSVIDTQSSTVSYPTVKDNPEPRIDHTATMISSKYILIIGGVVYSHDVTEPAGKFALNPISMSSLLLFDTSSNKWFNVTAGGNIPAPRRGHSAVLSLDGENVIVFGGGMPEDDKSQLNDVFILELATMKWTAPSIKGVPPKPRKYHKSYLVNDLMLVVFGLGGDEKGFDDVSILSTSSWSWITQYNSNMAWLSGNETAYDPNSIKNNATKNEVSPETRIKAGVIAGVVSGGVVILGGGVFLITIFVIFRKRQRKNKKSSNSNIIDPASIRQDDESVLSDLILEPAAAVRFQKPDNPSLISYATQIENGGYYKPDEKNEF